MSHRSRVTLAVLAGLAVVAAVACGGDDPTPPEDLVSNLAGTYDLTSFSSLLVTAGETLNPPEVAGTFVIRQEAPTGPVGTGTFEMTVRVPDGLGGEQEIVDQGTFTVRSDGTMDQVGALYQTKGTFTLQGSTLTVMVSEPALAVSTSVWQRK